ncbi:MAG: HlyD family efflux transporter periplasmic adaptor subunit [Pseudanabaenaceae cyanobacterium bins.68]|nr:HlyD family efflux transporter periplasmic adaptor subunit [Pseudanabaenaceae cyanobacterium bins.68]
MKIPIPSAKWSILTVLVAVSTVLSIGYIAQKNLTDSAKEIQPVLAVDNTSVTALGRIEPASEVVKVSTSVNLRNDRIKELLVKRGDRLQKNQVIAILESSVRLKEMLAEARQQVQVEEARLFQVRSGAKQGEIAAQSAEIRRLEANLRGELATQTAIINRRQSEANLANSEYQRYVNLYQEGAISKSELDQRRLNLETTQAQLNEVLSNRNSTADSLRNQLLRAEATLSQIREIRPADIQFAEAEVAQAEAVVRRVSAELAESIIRSPIAGQVIAINAKAGEAVGDDGIVEIGSVEAMEVVAEVYQSDLPLVKIGQRAIIRGEGIPRELAGKVTEIGQQVLQQRVFSNQPGQNLDRRVIQVRIRLNPKDSKQVENLTNLQVQVSIQGAKNEP